VPELSVVIATVGRRESLRRTLEHLAAQTVGRARHEVIVVSGAEATPGEVLGARHLARPELTGPAGKRDAGWRAASAPLVLFLDDDVLAAPDLLERHLRAHAAEPAEHVALLGRLHWARELRVTPFMRWLERGIMFDYATLDAQHRAGAPEAGWGRFYTANVSVKRALLERVDGFDVERFSFGYEDLDLAKRMFDEAGLCLRYDPEARAEHLSTPELDGYRERMATVAPAERRFVERHPDVRPYFFELFSAAAGRPRARGRSARLAAFVPRGAPWLGPRVWASAEARFAQELAGPFLAAWETAAAPPS
jgi:GT2 family glycosyltransferase